MGVINVKVLLQREIYSSSLKKFWDDGRGLLQIIGANGAHGVLAT